MVNQRINDVSVNIAENVYEKTFHPNVQAKHVIFDDLIFSGPYAWDTINNTKWTKNIKIEI